MVDGQDENKSYTFTPPNQADSVEVKTDLPAEQNVPEEEELDLTTISEDEVLIPEVIQLNGREYAVGMFWQPLQDVDEPLSEVRQTMDSDEAYNLYALHYGRAPQYGIGQKRKGHKEGQYAGAISLLDALSDKSSFLAVFRLPEGWWFVAARNDLILPEEDVLYQTEEEAKNAYYAMMAVPDWGYKIAPDSWNIDGAEEKDLSDLVMGAYQARLYGLSAIHGTKIIIAIIALIAMLIAFVGYMVVVVLEKATSSPSVPAPVLTHAQIETVEPEREEEKPWEKLVEVNPFLERCWSYSYQLKAMQVPGWSLGEITCTPTEITTSWSKSWPQAGRVAWLRAAYEEYRLKDAKNIETTVNESGTSATIKVSYTDLPTTMSVPNLSVEQIKTELIDISQALGLSIPTTVQKVTTTLPEAAVNNGSAQSAPPTKTYQYVSFSFSSQMDPPAWESFFDKFSALEVVKVSYNPKAESALSNNWRYEGRIYERMR